MRPSSVRYIVMTMVILLALVVQTAVLSRIHLFGVRPDLILVLASLTALIRGSRSGFWVGLAGGLVGDLFTGSFVGLGALSKALTAYMVGTLGRRLFGERILVPLVAVAFASLFEEWLYVMGADLFGQALPIVGGFTQVGLPVAGYNVVLTPLVFPWLLYLYRVLERLEGERSPVV